MESFRSVVESSRESSCSQAMLAEQDTSDSSFAMRKFAHTGNAVSNRERVTDVGVHVVFPRELTGRVRGILHTPHESCALPEEKKSA